MTTHPLPSDPSDDELESLAEDLFGVDLSADQEDMEPFEVEEFDLEDDPFSEEIPVAEEVTDIEPPRTVSQKSVSSFADDDDDFGGSLLDSEDDIEEPPRRSQPIATPQHVQAQAEATHQIPARGISEDSESSDEEELETASASSADDSYWDALEGWEWDDDPNAESKRVTPFAAEEESPFEEIIAESLSKTDELLDDDEFGAGLEDATVTRGAEVRHVAPAEEDADADDRPRRRRRRGRRRKGKADFSEGTALVDDESDVETTRQSVEEDDFDTESSRRSRSEELTSEDEDSFGAGLEVDIEEGQEEPVKKRRRTRGGRRRRGRRGSATESEAASIEKKSSDSGATSSRDSEIEADFLEADQVEETSREERNRYANIPTWEEAIGYLIRPSGRRTSSNTGDSVSEGKRRGGGQGRSGSRRGGGRRGGSKRGND